MKKKKLEQAATSPRNAMPGDAPIIYIHGISAHPPAEEWKQFWDHALFGRKMGARTIPAYWANILHNELDPDAWGQRCRQTARLLAQTAPTPRSQIARATTVDPAELLESMGLDPHNGRNLAFTRQLLQAYSGGAGSGVSAADTRGPSAKSETGPTASRSGRNWLARYFLQSFFQDVAVYFLDTERRRAIQERLRAALAQAGQPAIIVAHSLGTVIAFETLSQMTPAIEVPLFVTVGSPLGLELLQDEIQAHGNALAVPAGVAAWHNFADRWDPIALDRNLSDDFAATNGVAIQDTVVRNTERQLLNIWDAHHSGGYLAHPKVRDVVYRAAAIDVNARFLVARDVCERFQTGQRQPVLIEILEPQRAAMGETMADCQQRETQQPTELQTVAGRGEWLASQIKAVVQTLSPDQQSKADIFLLRKYVSARLTPDEIVWLSEHHAELNIYRVWRSAPKRALMHHSVPIVSGDLVGISTDDLGAGIVWAVLDTGCLASHPHFNSPTGATIAKVYDCTRPGGRVHSVPLATADDRHGHGTHVAGIIAGSGQHQGQTLRGVAPRTQLYIYKVLDDRGQGEDAWIIKAIDHIWKLNQKSAHLKIHGVNISWGGGFDPTVFGCGHSPICTELRDLWQQGVVVCVAAGNDGRVEIAAQDGTFELNPALSIGDPANLEECIAVGSTHKSQPQTYGVSYFSSRGPTVDGRQKPDLVAPGEKVLSCSSRPTFDEQQNRVWYSTESGTSMACPHVSGVIAAFLSQRPQYLGQPDHVKQILLRSAISLGRHLLHQGAGVPHLAAMLAERSE